MLDAELLVESLAKLPSSVDIFFPVESVCATELSIV